MSHTPHPAPDPAPHGSAPRDPCGGAAHPSATDAPSSAEGAGIAYRALVVTASNRASAGVYEDKGGPLIAEGLARFGFAVEGPQVVPDGDPVEAALRAGVDAGMAHARKGGGEAGSRKGIGHRYDSSTRADGHGEAPAPGRSSLDRSMIAALNRTAARGINPAQGRRRRAVLLPGWMGMKPFMPSIWRLRCRKQAGGRR